MLSSFAGMTMSAYAANVTDTSFAFANVDRDGFSEWRAKMDTSKVYVYPQSGLKINYTVEGRIRPVAEPQERSYTFAIPVGTKGSITNKVRENGDPEARLHFEQISYSAAYTRGVWSPDSTRNYTVY